MRQQLRRLVPATAGLVAASLLAASPAVAAPYDPEAECVTPTVPTRAPEGNQPPVLGADTVTVRGGTVVDLPVLANDTDPDDDPLAVLSTGGASRGFTCVLDTGSVRYVADPTRFDRRATIDYSATDGERLRSGQVAVRVLGTKAVKPVLRLKLRTDRAGKVTRRAALRFTNPNDVRVTVWGLNAEGDTIRMRRTMNPGGSFVWRTGAPRVQYLALIKPRSEDPYFVNYGILNNRTGRHPATYIGTSFSVFGTSFDESERRAPASLLDVVRAQR